MRVISDDGMKTHFCVRPHVTVPSVLQDIFSSFMSSICLYADMIEDLQNFCSKLRDSCKETKVCGTYEAYRCALLQELQKFYETLSLLEQRAHRQGMCYLTLYQFITFDYHTTNLSDCYCSSEQCQFLNLFL